MSTKLETVQPAVRPIIWGAIPSVAVLATHLFIDNDATPSALSH